MVLTKYLLLILTASISFISAYLSLKVDGTFGKTWVLSCLLNMIPVWSLFLLVSRDLVLDALIFDTVLIFSFFLGLIYWGESTAGIQISKIQIAGILLIICGFVTFKYGEN